MGLFPFQRASPLVGDKECVTGLCDKVNGCRLNFPKASRAKENSMRWTTCVAYWNGVGGVMTATQYYDTKQHAEAAFKRASNGNSIIEVILFNKDGKAERTWRKAR